VPRTPYTEYGEDKDIPDYEGLQTMHFTLTRSDHSYRTRLAIFEAIRTMILCSGSTVWPFRIRS